MSRQHHERGSVFFYILLGIALFSGLTYAVTQSLRVGSGTIESVNKESTDLDIVDVMNYFSALDNTVAMLKASGKCPINKVSFENSTVSGYTNSAAPSDKSCHVFNAAGGGLRWINPPSRILDSSYSSTYAYGKYYITGGIFVTNVGTTCAAGSCSELVIAVQGVSKGFCDAINQKFGNGTTLTNGSFTNFEPAPGDQFTGSFYYWTNGGIYASQSSLLGKKTGCLKRNDLGGYGNPYLLYHVIVAR